MCRSLLAVAFLLLLDSPLFSPLVSGNLLDDVSDGKKSPTEPLQAAQCLPNITSNGVPLNATISRVLSSPKVLPCADTISKALKAMFQLGKTHSCQPSRKWRDSPEFYTIVPLLSRNL